MIRKNCKNCGKFVWRYKSDISESGNVFCSKKCAAKRKRPWRKTGKKLDCDGCGKKIYVHRCNLNRSEKHYCSWECSISDSVETVCKYCNKTFKHKSYWDRKYCSLLCSVHFHSERRREIRECSNCGKRFEARLSEPKYLCSRKCSQKHAKKYPNTLGIRNRIRQRQRRENLHDIYVKHRIQQQSGISAKNIPQELIELKRLNIKRKRIIKNNNQTKR